MPLCLAQHHVDLSYRLSTGGWLTMLISVGLVTLLFAWCVSRVLRGAQADKLHSQADIDTRDTEDA